jgi:predicted O-methyltransferase YrrM
MNATLAGGKKIAVFFGRYFSAIFSCAYLFTVGLFSARHRGFLAAINAHFGRAAARPSPLLPEIGISACVPDDVPVQLREPETVDGNVSLGELLVIARLARFYRPAAVFEIGTFDGRTTLALAANSPPEARVYTLDLPAEDLPAARLPLASDDFPFVRKAASGSRFRGTDCASRITQLYGDSAAFDFSDYYGRMDLVFVDGAHSREYVLSDSRIALKLLRGGKGAVVWHDYGGFAGVTEGLNELYRSGGSYGGLRRVRGTSLALLVRA